MSAKGKSRPSVDHSTLSPSGKVSKRVRKAALAKTAKELFPPGFWDSPQLSEDYKRGAMIQRLRDTAKQLRGLADRGMKPKAYYKRAAIMEIQADELERGTVKENPSEAWVIALYMPGSFKRLTFDAVKLRFTDGTKPALYRSALAAKRRAESLVRKYENARGKVIKIEKATDKERGAVFGSRPFAPDVRENPSPRAAQIEAAARLQESFSGHEPARVTYLDVPNNSVFTPVGKLTAVMYDTVRDGKSEKYIHRFRRKSRPLLATSHDGTELRIVGGRFRFTEAGIEDQ